MAQLSYVKSKMRQLYTAKLTYIMLILQIIFLIMYILMNHLQDVSGYLRILRTDIFLWIVCIPMMVVTHKVGIYSTYYHCISRFHSKKIMIVIDYIVLALSTTIIISFIIFVPLLFMYFVSDAALNSEVFANVLFLVIRYIVLGLLSQCITYSLFFSFPMLQKHSNSICAIPIILFFVLTFPVELLTNYNQYIPALDFTVRYGYSFEVDGSILWGGIFFYNSYLLAYLFCYIWVSIDYLSKRMEFLEDANHVT